MKIHILLEKFWFGVAILTTLLTLYLIVKDGFNGAKFYILITGLVWGMFLVRRGIRKRMDKFENEQKQENKK
ncbi:MAG: hypothetical protein N4A35_14235 [Flavobacteriales bacterium]|jgi:uncharacterized protein YneF (UPF0154 family)|nr:hypothetical protein [Flavobacteriales bacterium]